MKKERIKIVCFVSMLFVEVSGVYIDSVLFQLVRWQFLETAQTTHNLEICCCCDSNKWQLINLLKL